MVEDCAGKNKDRIELSPKGQMFGETLFYILSGNRLSLGQRSNGACADQTAAVGFKSGYKKTLHAQARSWQPLGLPPRPRACPLVEPRSFLISCHSLLSQ